MRAGLILTGVFLMIVGFALTITLIGAILGIPIGFIGFIALIVGLVTSEKKDVIVATPGAQQQQQVVLMSPGQQGTATQGAPGVVGDFKYCPRCGTRMDKSAVFCPSCGTAQK